MIDYTITTSRAVAMLRNGGVNASERKIAKSAVAVRIPSFGELEAINGRVSLSAVRALGGKPDRSLVYYSAE